MATVADLGGGGVDPEPWAYVAALGYVTAAAGCLISTRPGQQAVVGMPQGW